MPVPEVSPLGSATDITFWWDDTLWREMLMEYHHTMEDLNSFVRANRPTMVLSKIAGLWIERGRSASLGRNQTPRSANVKLELN